eukprot:9355585-Pyramimonas_sp.AAC.1
MDRRRCVRAGVPGASLEDGEATNCWPQMASALPSPVNPPHTVPSQLRVGDAKADIRPRDCRTWDAFIENIRRIILR